MNISHKMSYVFIASTLTLVACGDSDPLNTSAQKLSNFGAELKATKEISVEQEAEISKLAETSVPVLKLASANAISTVGINFKNQDVVVLESISGNTVKPCGKIEVLAPADNPDQSTANQKSNLSDGKGCNIQIVNPSDELKSAVGVTAPINGEILKDGKKIPAKFVVSVTALYEGSQCTTVVSNGVATQVCNPPRPNRR